MKLSDAQFKKNLDSISWNDIQLHRRVKAKTMSVILSDSMTTTVWVEVDGESCNLTLRFDRGNNAVLCGFPMSWNIHNVNVDYFDQDSPTAEECIEDGLELDGPYISKEVEQMIFKKLLQAVYKQFSDCSWMDCCPTVTRKNQIMRKIQRAIERLA